jgi:hypothetical protein
MCFTLRTIHMPAAGWRLCVDGVEIVWRCACGHPQDTSATGQETAAARIMKGNLAMCRRQLDARKPRAWG